MSFLWRGNSQNETPTCKDCIDKDKRMSDYELFFNESKDVLKKKDEQVVEMEVKMDDVLKKMEEQEITIQSQKIFRDKLIEEYEFSKKVHQEEKRQWFENKAIWHETKSELDSNIMSLEVEKSNLEEQISEDKMIWRRHQKVLEDKIQGLMLSLKVSEEKYEDLKRRMKTLEIQNIEMEHKGQLKQEETELKCLEKMENVIDEHEKKEQEWKNKEEEYDFLILRYQENELDYEMRIQDMKYNLSCEMDELEKRYKEKLEAKDQEWENRIKELNHMYDHEFLQFKEHFKNKEQKLEREKDTIEQTLKYDIEVLKRENMELEESKRQIEKKRIDVETQWNNRETGLIYQIESLSLDNQRLEKEWKEERKANMDIQKKMENEYQTLMGNYYKNEMEKNQKIIEDIIVEDRKVVKETQTNDINMYIDDSMMVDETSQGLRQRKKKTKRNHKYTKASYSSEMNYGQSSVESENFTKNDAKKKLSTHMNL